MQITHDGVFSWWKDVKNWSWFENSIMQGSKDLENQLSTTLLTVALEKSNESVKSNGMASKLSKYWQVKIKIEILCYFILRYWMCKCDLSKKTRITGISDFLLALACWWPKFRVFGWILQIHGSISNICRLFGSFLVFCPIFLWLFFWFHGLLNFIHIKLHCHPNFIHNF